MGHGRQQEYWHKHGNERKREFKRRGYERYSSSMKPTPCARQFCSLWVRGIRSCIGKNPLRPRVSDAGGAAAVAQRRHGGRAQKKSRTVGKEKKRLSNMKMGSLCTLLDFLVSTSHSNYPCRGGGPGLDCRFGHAFVDFGKMDLTCSLRKRAQTVASEHSLILTKLSIFPPSPPSIAFADLLESTLASCHHIH